MALSRPLPRWPVAAVGLAVLGAPVAAVGAVAPTAALGVLGVGVAVLALGLAARAAQREAELRGRLSRVLAAQAAAGVPADAPPGEVLLILPALDEAANLESLLPRLPQVLGGHPVRALVVDDGSTDATAAVAGAAGALVARNPVNMGGGHALKVGFAAARRRGSAVVVTLDADGQHRPEDLPALVAPVLDGTADLVVGSRRLGASVGHDAFRSLGLDLYNRLVSLLSDRRTTDCSSGLRAIRRAALDGLPLEQDRHHTAELLIAAARAGLRAVEVPVTIVPRVHGQSKKGANWLYGLRFGWTVLRAWWG